MTSKFPFPNSKKESLRKQKAKKIWEFMTPTRFVPWRLTRKKGKKTFMNISTWFENLRRLIITYVDIILIVIF